MPRPRRLSASSATSSDPDTDRQNVPRRRPSAPPVPTSERPGRPSRTRWRPPNPGTLVRTQHNIRRLRAFQRLPGVAQVRVLQLHMGRRMPIPDAIDAAVSEQRLGLDIVQPLTQAREQRAATIRLTLERLSEGVFTQWIMLNVLVQGLPVAEQDIGRQLLRLVSVDPRDLLSLAKAQNVVVGMGPGHELLKRTVDTLSDLATSFHRTEENLRGLRQYDRHQPIPEPDPIEGPPDGVFAPGIVLVHEGNFKRRCQSIQKALDKHGALMDEWMNKIIFAFANRAEDAVLKKLHKLAVGWRTNPRKTFREDWQRQVLEALTDQSCWNDPNTDDEWSILLGAFFKCSFASPGFPDREIFSRLSGWDQINMPDLAAVAMEASNTLKRMYAEAEAHWNALRSVLMSDIEGLRHRLTPTSRRRWLNALRKRDIRTLEVLQRALPDDNLPWPPKVKKRIFSLLSMHWGSQLLGALNNETWFHVMTLKVLTDNHYLPATREVPRLVSKLYSRATHYSHLLRQRSLFKLYHRRAVQQFRDMVEQSCSNHRARKLILAVMPASGRGTNLKQVRNIAVAAQLQQKSILDGATKLWLQEAEMAKLSSYIKTTEREHLHYLFSLPLKEAEELLSAYDANSPVSLDGETLPDTLLNNSFSRPYFHPPPPASSSSSSDVDDCSAIDLAGRLAHTPWRAPLRATILLLRCALSSPENCCPRRSGGVLITMGDAELKRLAQLALCGLFHASAAAITATTTISLHRDRARALLSRHAWTYGLHAAWLRWQRDAVVLVNRLRNALWEAGARLNVKRGDAWDEYSTRASRMLLCGVMQKQLDWMGIEYLVATTCERSRLVEPGLERDVYMHCRRLRVLRGATDAVLGMGEEVVDARMLPPDLREGERPSPKEEELLATLHALLNFDRPVLEGGRAVPYMSGWEAEHERLVYRWRMEELCSAFGRLSLG